MCLEVSTDEIVQIFRTIAPEKALGPGDIPNRFLRECRGAPAEPLAKLFQDCLQRAHHQTPFRHYKTIVLRKPQKPAYVAKAYSPIALLNTLGKVLEKKSPDGPKPDCDCGWPSQTPKHIILLAEATIVSP